MILTLLSPVAGEDFFDAAAGPVLGLDAAKYVAVELQ